MAAEQPSSNRRRSPRDDELLPAAMGLQPPQQPYVLGPLRESNYLLPAKLLQERAEKEKTVAHQQQLNAGVVQLNRVGFTFASLLGSPYNSDIASNWDDALFDQEDMEVLFGLDELDASPVSGLPVQHSIDLLSDPYTNQLISSDGSDASAVGGEFNVIAVPPMKIPIAKNPSIKVPAITGRKRMKRQDEVAMLREEAPKLEAQLDMLREYWRQESIRLVQQMNSQSSKNRDPRDINSSASSTKGAEPEWKSIAAQRRDELTSSVKQNEWLKAQFQLQKKALQHIRKLIKKRVASAQSLQRQLDAFFQLDPQNIRVGNTSMFQFLLSDSNAMFKSFEKIQSTVSLRKLEDDEHRSWELQRGSANEIFVEMTERFVIPFDRSLVIKALRCVYEKREVEGRMYEFLSSSDDTIITQFIADFANSNGSGRVRTQHAVRISESETTDSTRFIVTGLIDRLTATGNSRNLTRLREQTWTLVTSCESSTPRHPLTVIQKYYTMAPEMIDGVQLDNLWDTSIIREMLIPTLDLSMDKLQRNVESELVKTKPQHRGVSSRVLTISR